MTEKTVKEIPLDGLYDFLERRGHTLLIKGAAGTGKTTLALDLMRIHGKGGKGVYFSTRVSPAKLYAQFNWLSEIVKPEHIISTAYQPDEAKLEDVRLADAKHLISELLRAKGALKEPVIVFDTWDGIAKEMDEKDRVKMEKTIISMVDNSGVRAIFVSEEPERTTID